MRATFAHFVWNEEAKRFREIKRKEHNADFKESLNYFLVILWFLTLWGFYMWDG